MLERYKTILSRGEGELIEKKSRFIATVSPADSEEKARAFIEEIKKTYWDATHNVFAYQIGERNETQRFSDDSEPQGTAGLPVLDVLRKEDIKNTVIVVTRYFGGTLLGTGGLVRAYGRCAKEGILAAGIVEMILYDRFFVLSDYHLSGKIQYTLLQNGGLIQNTDYTDTVAYDVLCETGKTQQLWKQLTQSSGGKCQIVEQGQIYGAWEDGTLGQLIDAKGKS